MWILIYLIIIFIQYNNNINNTVLYRVKLQATLMLSALKNDRIRTKPQNLKNPIGRRNMTATVEDQKIKSITTIES